MTGKAQEDKEPEEPSPDEARRVRVFAWQLRALADLVANIGQRKFPEAFLAETGHAESPTAAGVTEKTMVKALRLLAALAEDDLTLKQAADKLCISIHTANQHIAAARRKLGATTTTGAVYMAMQQGLIKV